MATLNARRLEKQVIKQLNTQLEVGVWFSTVITLEKEPKYRYVFSEYTAWNNIAAGGW
jgi:hypothetical protein